MKQALKIALALFLLLPLDAAAQQPIGPSGGGSGGGSVTQGTTPWVVSGQAKSTYTATTTGYTGYTTPTDMACIWGSATKTVKLYGFNFGIGSTSASAALLWQFIKRTTADTGGTPTSITAITSLDSNNAAATASLVTYGAAPTTGTGTTLNLQWITTSVNPASNIFALTANLSQLASASNIYWLSQSVTLRGVGEGICVNFNGAALPAGFTSSIVWMWTEE